MRVYRLGDRIVVEHAGARIELDELLARRLLVKLAAVLGMKVSTGKPVLHARRAPGGVKVTIIEGSNAKEVFVPSRLLDAYTRALARMPRGKPLPYSTVAYELLRAAARAGVPDAAETVEGRGPEEAWKLLFGDRRRYYSLFRVPLLLLQEQGLVRLTGRSIRVYAARGGLLGPGTVGEAEDST